MVIYGVGFLAVFLVFVLLHWHAYRKRHTLELNPVEIITTRSSISAYGICVLIALLSIGIVAFGGSYRAAISGWLYALIGPLQALNGVIFGKQIQKLQKDSSIAAAFAGQ